MAPSPLPTPLSTADSRHTLPQLPSFSYLPGPAPAQLLPSVPDTEPGLAREFKTLDRKTRQEKGVRANQRE